MQLAQSDADHQYYEIIQKDCDKGKAIQQIGMAMIIFMKEENKIRFVVRVKMVFL